MKIQADSAMMLAASFLTLAVALILGACAPMTLHVDPTFCANAQPILVSKLDNLTAATVKAIRDYDEKGAQLCGWGKK